MTAAPADRSREHWYLIGNRASIGIRDGEEEPVALVSYAPRRGTRSVDWTAALVAAAPDLLRYCRDAVADQGEGRPLRAQDVSELRDLIRRLDALERGRERLPHSPGSPPPTPAPETFGALPQFWEAKEGDGR